MTSHESNDSNSNCNYNNNNNSNSNSNDNYYNSINIIATYLRYMYTKVLQGKPSTIYRITLVNYGCYLQYYSLNKATDTSSE